MKHENPNIGFIKVVLGGFVAGFIATITFHQVVLWALWHAGLAPFKAYVLTPLPPMGVPSVIMLAFWGGVWGILFCLLQNWFSDRAYYAKAFAFGAIFPSLVALLIVLPLKGKPIGGGWHWPLLVTAFLINGAWGFGTAAILKVYVFKAKQTEFDPAECVTEVTRED